MLHPNLSSKTFSIFCGVAFAIFFLEVHKLNYWSRCSTYTSSENVAISFALLIAFVFLVAFALLLAFVLVVDFSLVVALSFP